MFSRRSWGLGLGKRKRKASPRAEEAARGPSGPGRERVLLVPGAARPWGPGDKLQTRVEFCERDQLFL